MLDRATYRDVKGWAADQFGRVAREDAAYFAAELRGITPASILEIGFGNGSFAGYCRQRGWDWTGIEADPELVSRATVGGFRTLGSLDEAEGLFDLIAGFDVFEHMALDDLKGTLARCRQLLSPGGKLIGRIPSGDSPFSGWIYNGDVTHRLLLGSSAIRQLAAEAGLDVVSIRAPALPTRGVGLRQGIRRALVHAAQWPITTAIRLAYHGGQPTVITSNLVFVLQRARA